MLCAVLSCIVYVFDILTVVQFMHWGSSLVKLLQEVGFWAAYCAGLIALFFVEKITALVQGVNLEDIVSNGWQAYAGVLSIPASGISPLCSCSSVCSLASISSDL